MTLLTTGCISYSAKVPNVNNTIQTSNSDNSSSGIEISTISLGNSDKSQNKSTMMFLFYVIPAAAILLIALFSIAISKRLFFEK
jgi:hypothetical protein